MGNQVIYYKSSVTDYTSVRPFPKGLRFVVGNPNQTAEEFRNHRGFVEGWECGDSYFNVDFPQSCPSSPDVQLNIRFQTPSCWDGKYLDTPDHKSHMSYPIVKPGTNDNMCPASHPVALPMLEFKMAFPEQDDWQPTVVGARHTVKGVTRGLSAADSARCLPERRVPGRQHEPYAGAPRDPPPVAGTVPRRDGAGNSWNGFHSPSGRRAFGHHHTGHTTGDAK